MMLYLFLAAFLAVLITFCLLLIGRAVMYMVPLLHGPVYVPSTDADIERMIAAAKIQPEERVLDLGSGKGHILLALAHKGIAATGYEINHYLVWHTKRLVARLGYSDLVTVQRQNFWKASYEEYDVLFLYGTAHIMGKLEGKLRAELKPGARVVSNYFQFPTWKPSTVDGKVRVYIQKDLKK